MLGSNQKQWLNRMLRLTFVASCLILRGCQILLSFSPFFCTSFLKPVAVGLTRILLSVPSPILSAPPDRSNPDIWKEGGFCEADAHRLGIDNDTLINNNPFWLSQPTRGVIDLVKKKVQVRVSLGRVEKKRVKGSAFTMDEWSPSSFLPPFAEIGNPFLL